MMQLATRLDTTFFGIPANLLKMHRWARVTGPE